MDIRWRTRDNDHPQGKPKVYLSCCDGDFKRYGEKIIGQLFAVCDCAVYFYSSGAKVTLDEDYRFNLEQMDLIVIPVSAELLYKSNRTMDFDVPYASECNIPILPLLQEDGLVELFNQRFGTMQFLCESAEDHTAIPYKEKLKTFLESVLTDDSLTKEIQDAFCARIFLSYRKKDRAYAQKLMSLVHQDEKLRDVAIWYDEFLIPGDDFNRNIDSELHRSDLFLMAVTPNVLEPDNYVMKTEYPEANKVLPVLPAELVATDLETLRLCYPGICDPVDAYNDRQRSQLLQNLLQGKLRQDATPRHKYLIGMAYFLGIDVEKNPEQGIGLLQEAAAEGVIAAAKKLANIYHLGDHVPRDYNAAKTWLTLMTDMAYEKFGACPDEAATIDLYQALMSAGNLCEQNMDDETAVDYFRQAIPVAEKLCSRFGHSRQIVVNCHSCVARVYIGAEHYDKALPYQKNAVAVLEVLYKLSTSAEEQQRLADGYCQLASCYQEVGMLQESVQYYTQTAEILQNILKLQPSLDVVIELIRIYDKLSQQLEILGNRRQQRFFDKQADRLYKAYRKELEATDEESWMLSTSYYMKRSWYRTAIRLMEKVVAVSATRAEEEPTFANRRKLAAQYAMMGLLWEARGKRKEAGKYHRLSVELLEILAKECPYPNIQYDLVEAYASVGEATDPLELFAEDDVLYSDFSISRRDRPRLEDAYDWFCKALRLFRQVGVEQGLPQLKLEMELLDYLGRLSRVLGRRSEAAAYYRQYAERSATLCDTYPSDVHEDMYAEACFRLALMTLDADLMEEARDCWRRLEITYPGNKKYAAKRKEAQRLLDA